MKYVKSFLFLHNRTQSKEIWKKFDKGKILFPKDSIKNVAEIFKKLNSFTLSEIELAKIRFTEWFQSFNQNELEIVISSLETTLTRNNLNWADFIECSHYYWEKEYIRTLNKINYRMCRYAN